MKTLDEALMAYYNHFDENYPLCIASCETPEEIIDEIEVCIETDKKAKEPVYEDGFIY